MKVKDITEARMGFQEFASVKLDDVRMGLEAECLLPDDMTRNAFGDYLRSKLNVTVVDEPRGSRDYSVWTLTGDYSIGKIEQDENGKPYKTDGNDLEIISSVYNGDEFFSILHTLFDVLNTCNVQTNGTTGLHIGISFKDQSRLQNLDQLKLLMFFGEDYLLSKYPRWGTNASANLAKRMPSLMDAIRSDIESDWEKTGSFRQIKTAIETLNQWIPTQRNNLTYGSTIHIGNDYGGGSYKSFAVALHRISTQNSYIEFRVIGGDDYHKHGKQIEQEIRRFIRIMEIASDPTAYTKEYYKKVAKMLIAASTIKGDTGSVADKNLKRHPHTHRAFHEIEQGRYDQNPDWNEPPLTDIPNNERRDVVMSRLINLIDMHGTNLTSPAVKRRIHTVMSQYKITQQDLIDLGRRFDDRIIEDDYNYSGYTGEYEEKVRKYFNLTVG